MNVGIERIEGWKVELEACERIEGWKVGRLENRQIKIGQKKSRKPRKRTTGITYFTEVTYFAHRLTLQYRGREYLTAGGGG